MSRIISFFLIICIVLISSLSLFSCDTDKDDSKKKKKDPIKSEEVVDDEKINLPEYKDYGRGTIDFDEIVYERPDCDRLIQMIESATEMVKKNELDYENQLAVLNALDPPLEGFMSMYNYSNIMTSIDSSAEGWAEEYAYIGQKYPSFSRAAEDLMVAAANSPYAEQLEADYFGDGLIEKYKDGGIYTDELVLLIEQENELESKYSALSTANVKITYKSNTDTVDNILAYYKERFGEKSDTYKKAELECLELYQAQLTEESKIILVDLIKVRKLISNELGDESYSELAYEQMEHDYSEKEMLDFFADVRNYIIPVYVSLENFVFSDFFADYESSVSLGKNKLVNTMGDFLSVIDPDMSEIFSYMLQHGLYNIDTADENRYIGSFATYLDSYKAPYLFITATETIDDYATLSHEFGHYIDYYINGSNSASLDLSEVSSNALEWLLLDEMEGTLLTKEEHQYLSYSKFRSSMEVFIFQAFYALFEHYAYQIEYDDISEESLTTAISRAAYDLGLNANLLSSLEYVIIPHIMMYPFYVQSYCVSEAISLEIFFMEKENEGAGMNAYMDLIDRGDKALTLDEFLELAGIDNPFGEDYLRYIADSIHYNVVGSHYYK